MPLDCFTTPVPPDYLRDESRKNGSAIAIAFPKSAHELTAALKQTFSCGLPLTVQGSRTCIAAGAVPDGGLIINLSRMDAISRFRHRYRHRRASDHTCPARGLIGRSAPTPHNRFPAHLFTPDPTETTASIGGMVACNASGACSFAYGPTRAHIEALTVVLADGDTLTLRRGHDKADGNRFSLTTDSGRLISGELPHIPMPTVKNSAGYWVKPDMDLLDLFIGSEGTLGILAEIELRLHAKPFQTLGILCFFAAEAHALACVQGDPIRRLRRPAPHAHGH